MNVTLEFGLTAYDVTHMHSAVSDSLLNAGNRECLELAYGCALESTKHKS